MRILAIDLETTGLLDDEEATVTEVSYALWDTDMDRLVKSNSYMVDITERDLSVPEEITKLTGITTHMLNLYGHSHKFMIEDLKKQMSVCHALMARNAEFDKGFVEREMKRAGAEMPDRPWICTRNDVEYPEHITGRSQSHVAADHGFVNPFPHWAIGDVLTMLRIHQMGDYGWETPLAMAQSPLLRVVANVSFERKDEAKELGFGWEPKTKKWFKDIRQLKFETEKESYTFSFATEEL